MPERIKVVFVDNAGDGISRELDVNAGISLDEFLSVHSSVKDNVNYRVNGREVDGDVTLSAGDRVTASPANIKGA